MAAARSSLGMANPIEDLVRRWKQNPSPGQTIALCEALRVSPRGPLVQQVGEFATQRHASDVSVLVSVARMYLKAQRLADAQAVLVAAGKQAPNDGSVYRWLGETLLRRGDAERAEKVLERAIGLDSNEAEARSWLDRARALRPMQVKAGARAVAAEVAHALETGPGGPDDSEDTATAMQVRSSELLDSGPNPFEMGFLSPRVDGATMVLDDLDVELLNPLPTGPAVPPRVEQRLADAGELAPRVAPRQVEERPLVPHPRDVLDALALWGSSSRRRIGR